MATKTIPRAAPGMPEAGLQVDMSGKTKAIMPKGKARYATASMEAFAKLQKAKAEALPEKEVAKEIFGTLSHEDASELIAGLDLRRCLVQLALKRRLGTNPDPIHCL